MSKVCFDRYWGPTSAQLPKVALTFAPVVGFLVTVLPPGPIYDQMSHGVVLLLSRFSSFHLPPNLSTVGNRLKGRAQRRLPWPLQISVIHSRPSLSTRVPPERGSVETMFRWLNQSAPEVWRMVHSHDSGL